MGSLNPSRVSPIKPIEQSRRDLRNMGSLFNPKTPAAQAAPPPPPMADQATVDREALDLARRRRGRAATVLTGSEGSSSGSVATQALLGS